VGKEKGGGKREREGRGRQKGIAQEKGAETPDQLLYPEPWIS